jgi:hypothetical protein
MLLYLNIILTLIFGLIIGLNSKNKSFIIKLKSKFHSLFKNHPSHQAQKLPFKLDEKQEMYHCFDTLEVRFLNKLLERNTEKVCVITLNKINNLTHLSCENQRQRRHLFLKELNLKLYLIFGIRESIVRIDSFEDKRVKNYILSNHIDKEKLINSLIIQKRDLRNQEFA